MRYTGLEVEEVCVKEQDCKWVGKQEEVISLRNVAVALYTYCAGSASVSAPVSKVSGVWTYRISNYLTDCVAGIVRTNDEVRKPSDPGYISIGSVVLSQVQKKCILFLDIEAKIKWTGTIIPYWLL
jgi:hypothetical protein